MPLPGCYVDAALRAVTPFDAGRERFGLAFDTEGGVVRIALGDNCLKALQRELVCYRRTSRPGVQSLSIEAEVRDAA